jgi:PIN domain
MPSRALVVDANILVRAVLGKRVREVFETYAGDVSFFVPESAYAEAEEHLAALVIKRGGDPEKALALLHSLGRLVASGSTSSTITITRSPSCCISGSRFAPSLTNSSSASSKRDRETTYHLRESAYRASLSPRSDAAPINVRNQIPVAHSFATSAAVGKVKWKVAPRPELALAHKRPPCDSTIERLIAKPMPEPCGLVVKNALKI